MSISFNTSKSLDTSTPDSRTASMAAMNCPSGAFIFVTAKLDCFGSSNATLGVTITDTAGNTYYPVQSSAPQYILFEGTTTNGSICVTFYAKNIIGHASNVITLHSNDYNTTYVTMCAGVYTGVDPTNPILSISSQVVDNHGGTNTTDSATLSVEGMMIVGYAAWSDTGSTGFTGNNSFITRDGDTNNDTTGFLDRIVTSPPLTTTCTVTEDINAKYGNWALYIITIAADSGGVITAIDFTQSVFFF